MSDVAELEERLAELRGERATLAASRTKEDVRGLAETWLAAACSRANGTAAGFVLNQHAGPEQVLAVIAEFVLDSSALLDFIVERVEMTTELTNRDRNAKVKKIDAVIEKAAQEVREAAKAEAIAAVERQYEAV